MTIMSYMCDAEKKYRTEQKQNFSFKFKVLFIVTIQ